jgi:hypothetical protein
MSVRCPSEEGRRKKTYTASFLVTLKHFPAPLKAETPSREWKETDRLKRSETLGITRLMSLQAKSISLSGFESKMASVFV